MLLNRLKGVNLNPFKRKEEEGFTLIELLVVIIIIGILAAIAVPIYLNQQAAAINASVQSDARNTLVELQTQLLKNPTASGFVVIDAGDTPVYSFIAPLVGNKVGQVPTANVPIPPNHVAVKATTSNNNVVVVVDPEDAGDAALEATSTGAWDGYVVHSESPDTGYWYEYNSLTGRWTDGTKTPGGDSSGPGDNNGPGDNEGENNPPPFTPVVVFSDDFESYAYSTKPANFDRLNDQGVVQNSSASFISVKTISSSASGANQVQSRILYANQGNTSANQSKVLQVNTNSTGGFRLPSVTLTPGTYVATIDIAKGEPNSFKVWTGDVFPNGSGATAVTYGDSKSYTFATNDGSTVYNWQTLTINFTVATEGSYYITVRGSGGSANPTYALIDNMVITQMSE